MGTLPASQSQGMSSCASGVSHHPPKRSSDDEARWSLGSIKAQVFCFGKTQGSGSKSPRGVRSGCVWDWLGSGFGVSTFAKVGIPLAAPQCLGLAVGTPWVPPRRMFLVRNDSPQQSPRDVASLLPPSPCQAKGPNSVPSCPDFQIAASHCGARGSPVPLHSAPGTPHYPAGLCISWVIAAHSRALLGLLLTMRNTWEEENRHSGKPFGKSQVCLQDPCLLWAVNLST